MDSKIEMKIEYRSIRLLFNDAAVRFNTRRKVYSMKLMLAHPPHQTGLLSRHLTQYYQHEQYTTKLRFDIN